MVRALIISIKILYINILKYNGQYSFISCFIAVAFRQCTSNGTWERLANYDQCINVSRLIMHIENDIILDFDYRVAM